MITFDHVTYTYEGREQPSLRDCSFTVEPGELVLLTGESGCGKTTIIRLINGLLEHGGGGTLGGTVTVNGQEVSKLPLWELAQTVGSVFQNPKSQFFNLDTTSEVLFGLESRGASHQEMEQALSSAERVCGVGPLLDRNIFALSGGEKQRIACASAYAMGPEVFVLDEPSSNLDDEGIRQLREILKQLKAAGKTVLVAEHRLWYAAGLADRVFYLREGRLERVYSGAEFLSLPEERRRAIGLRSLTEVPLPEPQFAPGEAGDGLSVRNLRASYDRTAVWEQVSFSAPRGQITAITGHNGAGKTTFSRAVCGLHKDCDGQFQWDGRPMERRERLKQSYMVMQDVNYELFADSVEAECSFGIRNPDQKLVTETLEELGIAAYRERHPNTLSGGQKQRVAVAVSMICGKNLLVFDEPTSGLDFDSMAQVAGLIRRLSDMGKVIFIVTHDFEFVCRTCSRVLHFDEGEMPDDVPVVMDALPKLRELFSVSDGKER